MIVNPISTVSHGNFSVYPTGTHHDALVYALDPDGDGVIRPEPNTGELILGYPALGLRSSLKVILRGSGAYGLQTQHTAYVRLYNGTTLLGEQSVMLYDQSLQTTMLTFSFNQQNLSQPRVGVYTFQTLPLSQMPAPDYINLTMLVLEDDDKTNTPPPYRKTELVPINDLRAPYWMMVVETNTDDPIEIPDGFQVVSLHPPLRYDNKQVLPPDTGGRTETYFLTIREG